MTPKQRAAMQQALEALVGHGTAYLHHEVHYSEAITALREALAEQAEGDIVKTCPDGYGTITTEQAEPEQYPTYGFCPICGSRGISRERRINGNDTCANGHSYASNLALHIAPEKQAEQEPVLMPVRRGTRITCMESDETCVVWTTSDTHAWVQFPDGQMGKYTYEQIGSYFSLDENYATDEAYERGLKEGIEAGKKIAQQAEQPVSQEPVTTDLMDMLRLIETIKYLRGIAERGLGREIRDDETIEQFVLGYVKQLETAIRATRAQGQQIDLTYAEISSVCDRVAEFIPEEDGMEVLFARAVIAKFKEKNK